MPLVDAFLSHDSVPASCKEYVEDMRIAPSIELSARQQEVLEHSGVLNRPALSRD